MLNPEQIRAARGMLDWSTADLAKESGLTINGINKIERGHVNAHRDTLDLLQKIFEAAGIEFLPGSGLRKKDRIVQTYEGEDANKKLIEDLYITLQSSGGEILVAHVDENSSVHDLDPAWLTEQIRKRKEAGITHRMLVQENAPNLIPPFDSYRCLPQEFFSPYPLFIYGSKLALLSWKPSPRVIVIDDERFADSARKLFNFIWTNAQPVLQKKGQK